MTRVTVEMYDGRYMLSAEGHATGRPDICAAVSAILYALGGYIANDPHKRVLAQRMESGDVIFDIEGTKQMRAAFRMAAIGLMQIAKKYPEYVRVEIPTE